MRFFNIDSLLMQNLSLPFDLMVLNVLTIVCSLPIITMGASTSALYDSVWKLKQNQGTLIRNYFQAFRKNFIQATFLFFLLLFSLRKRGLSLFAILHSLIFYKTISYSDFKLFMAFPYLFERRVSGHVRNLFICFKFFIYFCDVTSIAVRK